jgi:transposase
MDSAGGMIRGGFLRTEDRSQLIALARDGSAVSRLTRRANAVVLLDDGWSCQQVADALLLNDDTIRGWHKLFEQRGIEGLTSFDMGGSTGFLSAAQEDALKAFVGATLPRSTRAVGAFMAREFGLVYESRSGLVALLHRLGLEYHKPEVIPRKLDEDKQKEFIAEYDKMLNSLANDEVVLFADAVHPTHAARPVGCWAPKQDNLAIEQTSGRDRINIHGAINLETGQTRMIDVQTVDAVSTITLLEAIEALYPMMALIHVFLDNALSPRQAGTGMAGAARLPDQAAFHSKLLSPPQSDRAAVGRHASKRHPQQMLRNRRPIRRCDPPLPA